METFVKCKICGEQLCYSPSRVNTLGDHLIRKHPNNPAIHFSSNQHGSTGKGTYTSKFVWSDDPRVFKTTVETWHSAPTEITCPCCGEKTQPLIRKQRNKKGMSEEKNEKLPIQQSKQSTLENANVLAENDTNTVPSSSELSQNSLTAFEPYKKSDQNLFLNSPVSVKTTNATPATPSLSKWVASNVQSITKLLCVKRDECESFSNNNPFSITTFPEIFLNDDKNPAHIQQIFQANIGTLNKNNNDAEIMEISSKRNSETVLPKVSEASNKKKSEVQINQKTALETNRPSASRPTTSTNYQLPETLISAQELATYNSISAQKLNRINIENVVKENIEELFKQAIEIGIHRDEERGRASSVVTIQPPSSIQEFIVRGRALPFESDSRLEIVISPPPYPPRVIHGPPPISGAPPSYSAVMRVGTEPQVGRRVEIRPSPPFIAPAPPPGYTQAVGYAPPERGFAISGIEETESYSDWIRYTLDQIVWGSDPITIVCPRCANVIVTSIHSRRSGLSHLSAVAMFFCGCWPCCLLPYCMDSCKNTYHYCPRCEAFLGVYRPWGQTENILLH